MSRTQEQQKKARVAKIHARVRDVVALFFVANDNVLGNAWFPYIVTLALSAKRQQTPALEALVMKSFEGFPVQRIVTDEGRMSQVVLFPNLELPDGGTLAVAYEVEPRTNIRGAKAQRWRRLRVLDPLPAGRSSRRGGGGESKISDFRPGEWGGMGGVAPDVNPRLRAVDNLPSMDPHTRELHHAYTGGVFDRDPRQIPSSAALARPVGASADFAERKGVGEHQVRRARTEAGIP